MCLEENASIKWFLEGILVVYKREGNGYWCMDIVIRGSMIIKEKKFYSGFQGEGEKWYGSFSIFWRYWLCNMLAKKLSVEDFSVVRYIYQGDLERSSMVI